ncbi:hypothetical protein BSLG_002567 [Batrachochytrium salamandrivorans]|nr:hypothetical protein BSLG_002567 [Batrachochytrium salamandrivorans]
MIDGHQQDKESMFEPHTAQSAHLMATSDLLLPVTIPQTNIEAVMIERAQDNEALQLRKALAAEKYDNAHSSYRQRTNGSLSASKNNVRNTPPTTPGNIFVSAVGDSALHTTPTNVHAGRSTGSRVDTRLIYDLKNSPQYIAEHSTPCPPSGMISPSSSLANNNSYRKFDPLHSRVASDTSQLISSVTTTLPPDTSPGLVHLTKDQQRKIFQLLKKKVKFLQAELDSEREASQAQLESSNVQIRTLQEIIESKQHRIKAQEILDRSGRISDSGSTSPKNGESLPSIRKYITQIVDSRLASMNSTIDPFHSHIGQKTTETMSLLENPLSAVSNLSTDQASTVLPDSKDIIYTAPTTQISSMIQSHEESLKLPFVVGHHADIEIEDIQSSVIYRLRSCMNKAFPKDVLEHSALADEKRFEFIMMGLEFLRGEIEHIQLQCLKSREKSQVVSGISNGAVYGLDATATGQDHVSRLLANQGGQKPNDRSAAKREVHFINKGEATLLHPPLGKDDTRHLQQADKQPYMPLEISNIAAVDRLGHLQTPTTNPYPKIVSDRSLFYEDSHCSTPNMATSIDLSPAIESDITNIGQDQLTDRWALLLQKIRQQQSKRQSIHFSGKANHKEAEFMDAYTS